MQDLLTIENIAKDYNGINVINDISISVQPGEIIGLLGPNGAGKTTLFYIIMGLIKPRKGTIKINNNGIAEPGLVLVTYHRNPLFLEA